MGHLILFGDGITYPSFDLVGESSLAISIDDTGTAGLSLNSLYLNGTTSVSIVSGGDSGGNDELLQLTEGANVLTTVTIKGSVPFTLGSPAGTGSAGDGVVIDGGAGFVPPLIQATLQLIDASAELVPVV
jgi:hypothetical protein